MGIQCLAILFALLLSTGVANVTIQPFNRTQPIDSQPISFAVLGCDIFTDFELNTTTLVESRWNITTGAEVQSPGTNDGKYDLTQGENAVSDLETLLIVKNLIYSDAGMYTCRARDNRDPPNRGPWVEAQVHLQLLVELASIETEISTFDNTTGVSLSCEMSLYLRPDEDLLWFRDGQSITSGSGRHSITYTDGSGEGQFGGDAIGSSRISTLVISQPQTTDSGTYTCAIRNTQHSQDIELAVENSGPNPSTVQPTSRANYRTSSSSSMTSPSPPTSTKAPASGIPLPIIIGAIAGVLGIIVIILIVAIIVVSFRRRAHSQTISGNRDTYAAQAVIMTETNVAYERKPELIEGEVKHPTAGDPVYEFIPEDSRADVVMLEANVAYDRKPGERQHVRADIMTEANVAYDRKPDFKKGEVKKPASVDPEYEYIREDSRTSIMTDANPAYD